jgi:hypothetical protein
MRAANRPFSSCPVRSGSSRPLKAECWSPTGDSHHTIAIGQNRSVSSVRKIG